MEKKKSHYELRLIKRAFRSSLRLRMALAARQSVHALGMNLRDVVFLVQTLKPEHFYKSMTSYRDHKIWQDVYHVPFKDFELYLKITVDEEGYFIISLKEQ